MAGFVSGQTLPAVVEGPQDQPAQQWHLRPGAQTTYMCCTHHCVIGLLCPIQTQNKGSTLWGNYSNQGVLLFDKIPKHSFAETNWFPEINSLEPNCIRNVCCLQKASIPFTYKCFLLY